MHRIAAVALLATSSCLLEAEAPADPPSQAFDHFYNMDYTLATREFRDFTVAHPESADGWNYLAQAIFYSGMFDCGIMGSDLVKDNDAILHSSKVVLLPERDQEMHIALAKAEALAQTRLKENPNDANSLYALGVSYGLLANYELLAKHAWLGGLKDANESRKLHEQVIRLDPTNYDARLVPGTHQYMVGTLPLFVRFAAKAAGVNGNKVEGLKKIEMTAARGDRSKLDAQILLAVLYRREGRSAAGIPILRKMSENFPRNFLFRIELAKAYADTGDKTHAEEELAGIDKLVAEGAPGYNGTRVAQIHLQENEVSQMIGQTPAARSELASSGQKAPIRSSLVK